MTNLKATLALFFRQNGQKFTVCGGGPSGYGILSHKGSANNPFQKDITRLGEAQADTCLLYTEASADYITRGAEIAAKEKTYYVLSAKTYFLADEPLYRYAVMKEGGEKTCLSKK